jgi:hypothetical protein
VTGRGWVTPNAQAHERWSEAPTIAFLDVDHDGKLETGVEPSGHCERTTDGPRCEISARRTVIHRIRNFRVTGAGQSGDPLTDDLVLFGDYHHDDGSADSDSGFCLAADPSVCSIPNANPFGKAARPLPAIAPCKLTKMTQDPSIDVIVHAGANQQALTLTTPVPLGAHFDVGWFDGAASIHVTTDRPMTQAIVWLGVLDQGNPRWSSEQASDLHLAGTELDVRVPEAELDACPGCVIVTQVAAISDGKDIGVYSEDRMTLKPPAREAAP